MKSAENKKKYHNGYTINNILKLSKKKKKTRTICFDSLTSDSNYISEKLCSGNKTFDV